MQLNREKHHRRSVRLKGYDYAGPGAYFVTVCAWNRECIFGDIINGEMKLNEYGKVVQREWMNTVDIRPNVELDEFIIMPNHFHGILLIDGNDGCDVGARRCLALYNTNANNRATHRVAPTTLHPNSLGSIIGQFKSIVTKQINRLGNTPGMPVWQRNYFEHVIRNEKELFMIRQYIRLNPVQWDIDQENPENINK